MQWDFQIKKQTNCGIVFEDYAIYSFHIILTCSGSGKMRDKMRKVHEYSNEKH